MTLFERHYGGQTMGPPVDEEDDPTTQRKLGTTIFERHYGQQQAAQEQAAPEDDGFSFTQMVGNIPSSAYNVGASTVQAIAHPIETAQGLYELGWEGLFNFYKDRYGSVDNFLNTLEKDPAGVFLEGSTILSGGGTLGARLPGMAGQIARGAQTAGRVTDPVYQAGRGAAALTRGAKKAATTIAGASSASYKAPEIAWEAGKQSAYEGVGSKLGLTTKTEAPEMFKRHMRSKEGAPGFDPAEGVKLIDEGERRIRDKAQRDIDADLAPIYADKRPFRMDKIHTALQDAYNIADTGSEASRAVQKKLANIVEEWMEPKFYKNKPIGLLTDKAKKMVPEKDIKAIGLDPATATHRDYLKKWYQDRRSGQGMDRLKRQLENVYPHYNKTRLSGQTDRMAQKVSSIVVNSVKDTIRNRWGRTYDDAMAKYGSKMNLIGRVRDTFGRKEDMVGRRLTSMNRDTVFADFGNRAAMLKEWAKEAGIPEANLPAIAAGRSVRGLQPRGMLGMTSGVGLGGAALALWNTPMAVVIAALHSPRMVGEAAYALGKAEGIIMKPLKAVDSAMGRILGVTKHGLSVTAGQAGTKADAGNKLKKTKDAISNKAKEMGYNLHQRVVDNIAKQLTSDDPEIYIKGLRTVAQNKRIMKLIEELGKGGE